MNTSSPKSEDRGQKSDDRIQEACLQSLTSDLPAPVHDCWNVIGVEGNGTCRELLKFIHCRNCQVFSAAALQLLDRPLPADFRRERAAHYAQAKQIIQPARFSVVIFRLGHEWLALHTTVFQEVAEQRVMHSLPHRRRGVALGLVNVRGELLICASAARLLGLGTEAAQMKREGSHAGGTRTAGRGASFDIPNSPISPGERLLVTNWKGQRLAFPVDEVQGTHRFPQDELRESPATITRSTLSYTRGVFAWRDRTVGLLDSELFFTALDRSLT